MFTIFHCFLIRRKIPGKYGKTLKLSTFPKYAYYLGLFGIYYHRNICEIYQYIFCVYHLGLARRYGMSGQSSRSGKVLTLPSGSGKEKDQSGFWDFWISKAKSKSSRSQSQSKELTHPSGSGKEKEQSVPFSFVQIVGGDEEWRELWHHHGIDNGDDCGDVNY